ncbi:MAG: nitroreductase [Desulfovibrio sp.]|nr:nitroreductase [Desulfovibrio sp.]
MEFKELMAARRSARMFRPDPVPLDVLEDIVRTAGRAPSWENSQPWSVYAAAGETLARIRDVWRAKYAAKAKGSPDMPTGHRTNFSARSQQCMASFMAKVADFTGDPKLEAFLGANERLFDAPCLVYLTLNREHTGWPVYDLGAFGMALMLAARDRGVDSIPAYELVKFPAELRPLLGVPDGDDIVMGIALGYAADDRLNAFASDRLPLDEILTVKN